MSERLSFEMPAPLGPQASFKISLPDKTTPSEVPSGEVVHLINVSNGEITGHLWDFGDGQTSTGQNPTHTYTTPGRYTITLTVTGPGGSSTASRLVIVTPGKVALAKLTLRLAQPIAGVTLVEQLLTVRAQGTVRLTAEGTDATGNPVPVTPTWTLTGDIGTITPEGTFTAVRVAGRRGTLIATADGVRDTLRVMITPAALARLTITPPRVTLRPRQVTVFRATGYDAFDNRVIIRPLWHTVGGIGTIDKRTGLFRAGVRVGTGYVIAYADSIFGDTGATLKGSAKVVVEQELPRVYALSQNFPNPFNPETTISYDLPEVADVRLVIYDLVGRKVRVLVHSYQQPGRYEVVWDGRETEGREVASGVYLYRLEAVDRGFYGTRQMVLIR
jgi:hypothetical protein